LRNPSWDGGFAILKTGIVPLPTLAASIAE
jgi:hypothetical protein